MQLVVAFVLGRRTMQLRHFPAGNDGEYIMQIKTGWHPYRCGFYVDGDRWALITRYLRINRHYFVML